MREVVSVFVGQAGVQMAEAQWAAFAAEHGIGADGMARHGTADGEHAVGEPGVLFRPTADANRWTPRAVLVDTEPDAIADVRRRDPLRGLLSPGQIVAGKESSAGIWTRGYYSLRDVANDAVEVVRRELELCDSVEAIVVNHACGSGTGGGTACKLLDDLKQLHSSRTLQVSNCVVPATVGQTEVLEAFNFVLSVQHLLESTTAVVYAQNHALYRVAEATAGRRPAASTDAAATSPETSASTQRCSADFGSINRVLAEAASAFTAGSRFDTQCARSVDAMLANLVPYRRQPFVQPSFSPVLPAASPAETASAVATALTDPTNAFASPAGNASALVYAASAVIRSPALGINDAVRALTEVRTSGRLRLGSFASTVAVQASHATRTRYPSSVEPRASVDDDDQPPRWDLPAEAQGSATLFANSGAFEVIGEQLAHQFDVTYSQRGFVHWYVGEGMESGEFSEARENLACVVADYQHRPVLFGADESDEE